MEGVEQARARAFWDEQQRIAADARLLAISAGGSECDGEMAVVEHYAPLRMHGGDVARGAALWQGQAFWAAARHAEAQGEQQRARWYRLREIECLEVATGSTDPWIRDYAYSALLNALDLRCDAPAMRRTLDSWTAACPERADDLHAAWDDKIAVNALPPLTDLERARIVRAVERWAARSPRPDDVMLYLGHEQLSPRGMAEHLRQDTETGRAVLRMLDVARTRMPLDEILATYEGRGPRRISHLRRFPVAVRARGRAVVVDGWDGAAAVEALGRTEMARGRALGYVRPGAHAIRGAEPRAAVLLVPLDADAGAYPRSINRIPVRLARMPRARAL